MTDCSPLKCHNWERLRCIGQDASENALTDGNQLGGGPSKKSRSLKGPWWSLIVIWVCREILQDMLQEMCKGMHWGLWCIAEWLLTQFFLWVLDFHYTALFLTWMVVSKKEVITTFLESLYRIQQLFSIFFNGLGIDNHWSPWMEVWKGAKRNPLKLWCHKPGR